MRSIYQIALILLILSASCSDTPKLEQTPLSITDISEIGELITAEYYGEVIQSLKTIARSDVEYELQLDFDFLKLRYSDVAKTSKNKNKLVRELRQNGTMDDYRFKRLQKMCSKTDRKFVLEILAESEWIGFRNTHRSEIDKYLLRREKDDKGEVVYLGRGWVKAGFDLTRIDFGSSVSISADTLTIHNLDPILLDADINPWLVPNKIKGFEIIKMENKVSLHQIHTVKRNCKLRLKQEAIAAGLYEHALSAGARSLEGLFGLMELPGTGSISTVIIEPTKYFEYKIEILDDARIDSTEFKEIKDLVNIDTFVLDSVWFVSLVIQQFYLKSFLEELDLETKGNYNHPQWAHYSDSTKVRL